MCAVIGALIQNPTKQDFESIRKVFLESKIRGMHATGMTILFNGKLITFKEPVPADKFRHLDDLEEMVSDDGSLKLIGHCRYSTSDLQGHCTERCNVHLCITIPNKSIIIDCLKIGNKRFIEGYAKCQGSIFVGDIGTCIFGKTFDSICLPR